MKKISSLLFSLLCMNGLAAYGQNTPPAYTTKIIADHLFIPWEIMYGPDDHIWFTQKNGFICRLNPDNGTIDTLYHQPQTVIHGEGGMLGMALAPGFPQDPDVFVAYEYLDGNIYKERVVKLVYDQDTLGQSITLIDGIMGANNHNGCRLLIVDNKLLITTGDATNTDLPQDITSLNGKILRINLDGSIPADNPIPGSPVWSWGHRNAEGLAYYNGILYSSEHGPNDNDELNVIKKGRNYGWPEVHGFCDEPPEQQFCTDSNVAEPLMAWTPTIAPCGIAYYHESLYPSLKHSLLMATLKDAHLYQLKLNDAGDSIISTVTIPGVNIGRIRDICVTPGGRVFLSTSNSAADGSQHIDRIVELIDTANNHIAELHHQNKVSIYPNPAGTHVHFIFWDQPDIPVTPYAIYDLHGRVVQQGSIKENKASIPVFALSRGIYFVRIPTAGTLQKLVLK